MNDSKGYYKLLGIPPGSPIPDVQKAYSKLQSEYHPELGKQRRMAEKIEDPKLKEKRIEEIKEQSVKLNEAKLILTDEKKKKLYDSGMDESNGFEFGGFEGSFFDMFTGRGRRDNGVRKVEDTNFQVNISFKESFVGKTSKFKIKRNVICKGCSGKGGDDVKNCNKCKGKGKLQMESRRGFFVSIQEVVCDECHGDKTIIKGKACSECKGNKYIKDESIVELEISPGVENGDVMTFTGRGDEKVNCVSGDLNFVINIKEDPKYGRIGNDIVSAINIDLFTALVGGKVYFEHVDGRKIEITIKKVDTLGEAILVQNEGFLTRKGRGDLYLKPKYNINKKINIEKLREAMPPQIEAPANVDAACKGSYAKLPEPPKEEDEGINFGGFRFF